MLCTGADVASRDELGGTPLMKASISGRLDIVRILLAAGERFVYCNRNRIKFRGVSTLIRSKLEHDARNMRM